MKNYTQPGHTIPLIAPYDVASGGGALIGTLFGVAATAVTSGQEGEFVTVGVYELPKATGVINQGAKVYWDNTAKVVTTTASGNSLIGAAIKAAGSSDAIAVVRLNGVTV
ncbi:DUF2190 family protein [Synechococcus elongatus]|uniref:DUF2190 family protein n=2 Tax=Synechococcus elongatus TaxID=32046 RepID=Q31QA2_SYNE7|nr:DUF2190 family protein [Synechococcus elongatus]ABB56767.1 conserved hypothetical protein [Synechococcus elongatus PCC 7942 = FACHB-805]AJD58693.1 hypothetical protein M744_13075 [Synechococcus elongatus UTEX 2973]MBD2588629.1 DUF2190 family protein [Synechococcus elongatus FACHB-242]MBD2689782.1 DUF2190 family protein [Synechococcus elongatus FACHB-1061]MBD2708389.1 DUF2190 family protein [Synechococcus elongatus PCC 7942 = FACHB-805]